MLTLSGLTVAVIFSVQVPAPNQAAKQSEALQKQYRAILQAESALLNRLIDKLEKTGQNEAATHVKRLLPPPPLKNGASRFIPLPEVVPAQGKDGANKQILANSTETWRADLERIRGISVTTLLDLVNRAAGSKQYALCDSALRTILERQPEHAESRRLLGYVQHDGGWATPYAAAQLREGKTLHPKYGWVPTNWLPHLEKGELPAPQSSGQRSERWLPAKEADELRCDWNKGWIIRTEHFEIKTNVPLSEAIVFGRHLEAFHDLFFSLMADVLGEKLPLAQRFKEKKATAGKPAERESAPHKVYYFATREEYIAHLRPYQSEFSEDSLGVYFPPKPGTNRRAPAYFFRDLDGAIAVTATLYHEVSHQLLLESGSAGLNDFRKNMGNYWVFEGLGTYFESLETKADGSLEFGGLTGPRIEAARVTLASERNRVPLAAFVRLDQKRFNRREEASLRYGQAAALTTYLMQGDDTRYRSAFLDYVQDAYHGRIRQTTGTSLEGWISRSFSEIETDYLKYLEFNQRGR